ncbi:MAG: alanine dehydrogenase, partial [Actinomycetota bacterium]|nr:alanine dehydrogenase [Actinomycetota bacterium]
KDGGAGSGFSDDEYRNAGAVVVDTAAAVFSNAELIVKVKEPQAQEYALITPRHTVFTYLHLAASRELTEALLKTGATYIAYETVTDATGHLPLLAPMSEVAGKLAVQSGAHYLAKPHGGKGVLIGGATGVAPAHVVILGTGVVGSAAAQVAVGMGARVTVVGKDLAQLQAVSVSLDHRIETCHSTRQAIAHLVQRADLVIGAVLVPGAGAPKLVDRAMLRTMQPGSVIVDVAIDQGGCFETSRPTTHADPVYVEEGVVHYCVANMPGAVPRTSTRALTSATLPFVLAIADHGVDGALQRDPHLRAGLSVRGGKLLSPAVGVSLGMACSP